MRANTFGLAFKYAEQHCHMSAKNGKGLTYRYLDVGAYRHKSDISPYTDIRSRTPFCVQLVRGFADCREYEWPSFAATMSGQSKSMCTCMYAHDSVNLFVIC